MDGAVSSKPKADVYLTITNKIVAMIEAGVETFRMPWHHTDTSITRPINAFTTNFYRGVNIVALWVESVARGYDLPYWATYKQWRQLGAQVRKGECGAVIVFFKEVEEQSNDGVFEEERPRARLIGRASVVFNAVQVDGWQLPAPVSTSRVETIEAVTKLVERTGVKLVPGAQGAYYNRLSDFIGMPSKECFIDSEMRSATEAYYAVLLHELTHWSGASHRLARQFGQRFGDHAYAMEELVAELGSAFLCADLGLVNEPRHHHAGYISTWLEALKRDPRAIFTAASKASQAAEYLLQFLEEEQPASV